MVFTTATFLVFLVVVFCLYWWLGRREWQNVLLVVAGYAFYAWWDHRFCVLMLLSTLVDYVCGIGCARPKHRKLFLVLSLCSNLGMLGVFKYFHFFQDSWIAALGALGVQVDPWTLKVILPVGISFYTFQTLSYTIDIYRGNLQPHRSLVDYAAYVCFFPQLVAGPIERASALLPQFTVERKFDQAAARDGLRQMLWGFFKKMAIADQVALVVNEVYGNPEGYGAAHLWVATICFSFQIYCDFSAYSDIAIGTARLFGFQLTRNFATPYFAQDFSEFWRRWHITLSTWFRDYVYVPLGGNRQGQLRQLVNVMIVFAVSGLWHGAGWNFVLWGVLHGFLVIASTRVRTHVLSEKDVALGGSIPSLAALARCVCVFVITTLVWVFFRADTFSDSIHILGRMLGIVGDPEHIRDTLRNSSALYTCTRLVPVLVLAELFTRRWQHPLQWMPSLPKPVRWAVYFGLIWATMYYLPEETGEFVYFQF